MKYLREDIPQVLAIAALAQKGAVALNKVVREHLDADAGPLQLQTTDSGELWLTPRPSGEPAQMTKSRLQLSTETVEALDLAPGDLLAFVQRDAGVALKKLVIREAPASRARVIDVETPRLIERIAETNPMPDDLLPALQERSRGLALRCDLRAYLAAPTSLPAWHARSLLDMQTPEDAGLHESLVTDLLTRQARDGSWEGEIALTARRLRELAQLGLGQDVEPVRRGAEWLLARSASAANPGIWFLSDELVALQAEIIARHRAGERGIYFRDRRKAEMARLVAGDDLMIEPCGPRIMWPNALAIEALMMLGYEGHPRVQRALRTLTTREWCECGYQNGVGLERGAEPMAKEQLEKIEPSFIEEYRLGGLLGLVELHKMDMAKRTGNMMPREAHLVEDGRDVYPLRMPSHIQDCEVVTVRALSLATDPEAHRFAAMHLWRFAGRQHAEDGRLVGRYRFSSPYLWLDLLSRFHHPAAHVMLMRSLPWIVADQHEDGSWGEGEMQDAATLAVVKALLSVKEMLAEGMRP